MTTHPLAAHHCNCTQWPNVGVARTCVCRLLWWVYGLPSATESQRRAPIKAPAGAAVMNQGIGGMEEGIRKRGNILQCVYVSCSVTCALFLSVLFRFLSLSVCQPVIESLRRSCWMSNPSLSSTFPILTWKYFSSNRWLYSQSAQTNDVLRTRSIWIDFVSRIMRIIDYHIHVLLLFRGWYRFRIRKILINDYHSNYDYHLKLPISQLQLRWLLFISLPWLWPSLILQYQYGSFFSLHVRAIF